MNRWHIDVKCHKYHFLTRYCIFSARLVKGENVMCVPIRFAVAHGSKVLILDRNFGVGVHTRIPGKRNETDFTLVMLFYLFPSVISYSFRNYAEGFVCLLGPLLLQFSDHTTYDCQVLKDLAPETVYITSVRDPATQVPSAFHFYYPRNRQKLNIHEILSLDRVREGMNAFRIPAKFLRNKQKAEWFVKNILGNFFQLVLVKEYLDESLVLLKRKLCWDLKDIVYSALKVQRKNRTSFQANDTSTIRKEKVSITCFLFLTTKAICTPINGSQNMNPGRGFYLLSFSQAGDYAIFQFFNNSLWQKISHEPKDFWGEVKFFKETIFSVKDFCQPVQSFLLIKNRTSTVDSWLMNHNKTLEIPGSVWNTNFTVTHFDCVLFALHNMSFK